VLVKEESADALERWNSKAIDLGISLLQGEDLTAHVSPRYPTALPCIHVPMFMPPPVKTPLLPELHHYPCDRVLGGTYSTQLLPP
jgi:hypothetical protein